MLNLRPEDILHRSYLNRLLIELVDNQELARGLAFKGGSCAVMLGYLDRFSVDLDFDVLPGSNEEILRDNFHQVFTRLGFSVKLEYHQVLFFQLRYHRPEGKRNILKVSAINFQVQANQYRVQYFPEIDRLINSQTIETMFANKLVSVTDRYAQHKSIAGRDIYDIHHFFIHGYGYEGEVIRERTGKNPFEYFGILIDFIKEHVTQTIINQDLNTLLPSQQFQQVRKILVPETLSFLNRERNRLAQ